MSLARLEQAARKTGSAPGRRAVLPCGLCLLRGARMNSDLSRPGHQADDLVSERRDKLFQQIFEKLNLTSEVGRGRFFARFGEIGAQLESDIQDAERAINAPSLKEARRKLRARANRLEKMAQSLEHEFLPLYGAAATENPYADPQTREEGERKQETRRQEQRNLISSMMQEVAKLREQADQPNWLITDGAARDLSIYNMAYGKPIPNFFTNCCILFEALRPGEITETTEGDFYVVAANIYELVTGQSPEEAFSLEYCVHKAVVRHKKNLRQK